MDFQSAIEEMNTFWAHPRAFENIHAQHIWNRLRITVCYTPNAAHGLFEKQPSIDPLQRLNFIKQLEKNLQDVGVKDNLKKVNSVVDKTTDQIFHCTNEMQREILKVISLFESPALNPEICSPQMWSDATVQTCSQWMHLCGFKEITRSAAAQENIVNDVVQMLISDCSTLIERTHIDPYMLGMGAAVSLEVLKADRLGSAYPYGTIILDANKIEDKNMSAVFFHEWFHMLDFAAFYAAQYPEVGSPLADLDEPLRQLHKSLIRMDVKMPSLDPYSNLNSLVEIWGKELGHTPQKIFEHIRQMKEVFHRDKNNRRDNLNTFFHTAVLEDQSEADLYPFIDKGLETFDIISVGLKGFHKYLQQGYSEFYSLSMQMDDNHYHTKRKPLKWYQKRKPYYSKPCEVLARSAEQFCAKKLGWSPMCQLEYPQRQEARRVYELFEEFFAKLAKVELSVQKPSQRHLK